jgi:uncharacterized protein (TIGR02246 family)
MTDEAAIREAIETWMRATADGDTDTVLALMTDDVVFTVAGREPFGKREFAAQSKKLQGTKIVGHHELLEVSVHGSVAWTRTELSVSVTAPGGKVTRRKGHTLSVWQKEKDGKWRLSRDANLLVES